MREMEEIYEKFTAILKEHYEHNDVLRITGMLYVAMQQTLGGDVPLNDGFSDFDKEEQFKLWAEAFKICNSYSDAIKFIAESSVGQLDAEEIKEGLMQVDEAQKSELFANFIVVARSNPKPTNKPHFVKELNKKPDSSAKWIEISEKDIISMKFHIDRYLKETANRKLGFLPQRHEITVHLIKEVPNYREFWAFKNQEPDGSGIERHRPVYLFSEYMDAIGHSSDDVFVRQYLFETRMTLNNREKLLKELRSTSPN